MIRYGHIGGMFFISYKNNFIHIYFAQVLYNNGMWGYGADLPENVKNLLIEELKNSKSLTQKINEILRTRKYWNFYYITSIEFTGDKEQDLYYSIQHANLDVSGKRQNNGKWLLNITIEDVYDFDSLRPLIDEGKLSSANAANDLGLGMQFTGMMTPYKISVTYSVIW